MAARPSRRAVRPGELLVADDPIVLFEELETIDLHVLNTGDRPVQVGSHFHFAEANEALEFDRAAAVGFRLAVPAGTSVALRARDLDGRDARPLRRRAASPPGSEDCTPPSCSPTTIGAPRGADQASLRRPLRPHHRRPHPTGRHRPARRVERDLSGGPGLAGDEAVFGGGKVIRESMGQSLRTSAEGAPDLVITGAVVLDHWGIVKADVGIKDGRIVALGKAGNPDTMDGVHPDLVIGPSTEIIAGNGRILTAGAIDSHVHLICPQVLDTALATGITTIIGGGTGPAEGTKATTVTAAPWYLRRCSPRSTPGRSTSCCSARATPCRPRRCGSSSVPGRAASSCTRTGARRPRRSMRAYASATRPASRRPCTPTR